MALKGRSGEKLIIFRPGQLTYQPGLFQPLPRRQEVDAVVDGIPPGSRRGQSDAAALPAGSG